MLPSDSLAVWLAGLAGATLGGMFDPILARAALFAVYYATDRLSLLRRAAVALALLEAAKYALGTRGAEFFLAQGLSFCLWCGLSLVSRKWWKSYRFALAKLDQQDLRLKSDRETTQ